MGVLSSVPETWPSGGFSCVCSCEEAADREQEDWGRRVEGRSFKGRVRWPEGRRSRKKKQQRPKPGVEDHYGKVGNYKLFSKLPVWAFCLILFRCVHTCVYTCL